MPVRMHMCIRVCMYACMYAHAFTYVYVYTIVQLMQVVIPVCAYVKCQSCAHMRMNS